MAAMKDQVQDILATQKALKENPFTVPDGYFESFEVKVSPWRKTIPYMAVAASLAFLLSVGMAIQSNMKSRNTITDEDYFLFSNSHMDYVAEAELQDEDIIEYLIYLGTSPESIELLK